MKVTIWKVLGDTLFQPTVRLGMGGLQQVSGMSDPGGVTVCSVTVLTSHTLYPAPEDATESHLPVPRVDCLLLPEQKEPKNSQIESTSGSETAKCSGQLRYTWCVAVSSGPRETAQLYLSAGPCTKEVMTTGEAPSLGCWVLYKLRPTAALCFYS